ncbi:MAG TPA: L-ribulose-5-phosphate 4-epimerase [Spirochaetota bacterium]|nr:L-ribulose-5-phosphate 4-epimerase [Spirochaetota bacterium]HQE60489.1 L-ribulose-5-phosphate 4-epimerase [Spirochaetota bacterium]
MSKYKELKEQAWLCNMELPKRGLVIYTFGNVSAADRSAGVFAIKPSGVPYEELKADDMVVVDFENKIVEGSLRYSSDTKTHTVLYNNFADINGVVHTHSTYSVAWAQAALPIPVLGTTHADQCAGDIPCTDFMTDDAIKGDYEIETGNQIVRTFEYISYRETEMVLVAGHGPFTWGTTPEKAVYNSAVLEELAKMAFITRSINSNTQRLKEALVDKHYQRKHGKNAYYGQASK